MKTVMLKLFFCCIFLGSSVEGASEAFKGQQSLQKKESRLSASEKEKYYLQEEKDKGNQQFYNLRAISKKVLTVPVGNKFSGYIQEGKQLLLADHYRIVLRDPMNASEGQVIFSSDSKLGAIRSVIYRNQFSDLLIGTNFSAFRYDIPKGVLRLLLHNEPIISLKQLSDNQVVVTGKSNIGYYDFESDDSYVFANPDRGRAGTCIAVDKKNLVLFFDKKHHFMKYDLKAKSWKTVLESMNGLIRSVTCKDGSIYATMAHALIRYDMNKAKKPERVFDSRRISLRGTSCNNDASKFLFRTDTKLFVYDPVKKFCKMIFKVNDEDQIWAARFYEKDVEHCIIRTNNHIEQYDLKNGAIRTLFEKDEKESALFALTHNDKNDKLIIATEKRIFVSSLLTGKLYLIDAYDDYISSTMYNDESNELQVVTADGKLLTYDLTILESYEQNDASHESRSNQEELEIFEDEMEDKDEDEDVAKSLEKYSFGWRMVGNSLLLFMLSFLQSFLRKIV